MIKTLNHINITVTDADRSLQFYRDLLGMTIVRDLVRDGEQLAKGVGVPNVRFRNIRLAVPGTDIQIEINEFKNKKPQQLSRNIWDSHYGHISLEVTNITECYNKLKNAGVSFISPPVVIQPEGIQFIYAYDPDNNVVEFACYPESE